VHEERKERVPLQDVQFRVLCRLGICGPRLPVEEGHLAEEFTGTQQRRVISLPRLFEAKILIRPRTMM